MATGRPPAAPEPIIAALYKFTKFLNDNESKLSHENWALLGTVRQMLGQKPMQMDGKSYTEMRNAIKWYLERWGIIESSDRKKIKEHV